MTDARARPRSCLWALYAMLALPVVIVLVYVTPPFQVADEANHFLRAAQIANGRLVARKLDDVRAGGDVDANAVEASRAFEALKFKPDNKLDPALQAETGDLHWGEAGKVEADFANTAIYPPFFYVAAAAGIKIGRAAHLSVLDTLYLARLLNGLGALAVATLGVALCARGRAVLVVTLSFPMVLSLFGSVSQDGLSIASGALVIGLWSHYLARDEDVPLLPRAGAALLLGAIVAARLPLLPLFGLLALPTASGRRLFSRSWLSGRDLASILVGLVPLAFGLFGARAAKVAFRAGDGVAPGDQLARLLHDPLAAVRLLGATLDERLTGYLHEMVGVLGWLDTNLPQNHYFFLGLCVGAAILAEGVAPEPGFRGWRAVLHVAAIVAAMLGGFFALYLAWTPVGAPVIDGVQGRYLLVPALFLTLACPRVAAAAKLARGGRVAVCTAAGLSNLWIVPLTVLHRYHG